MADSLTDTLLSECQSAMDYRFKNIDLLKSALTHASGANHRLGSNERLEFLGDAVLGIVICDQLYRQFPELLEGDLTKIKSVIVSRKTCTQISKGLGLDRYLIVGKGMSPVLPEGTLSDVFEALIAAIYLDAGLEAARSFILRHLERELELVAAHTIGKENHKSLLQQVCQKDFGTSPTYQVQDEKGPDHAKCFLVSAVIEGRTFPSAWGKSKKEAEQLAAQIALQELSAASESTSS